MEYTEFLRSWHVIIDYALYASLGFILLIYLTYLARYSLLSTPKKKYDFVSKYEVRVYKIINALVALAFILLVNLFNPNNVIGGNILWFFVRFGIGIVIGVSHLYIAFLILNVYYPKVTAKKLSKLRQQVRINPKTGNKMKLLSEEEEDVHLDKGMQAEEKIFSIDYDVWIDESTGDTTIEKYPGNLVALICDNCEFQTLRIQKEEVVKNDEGEEILRQYYACSHCDRTEERDTPIKSEDEEELITRTKSLLTKPEVLVKVQIIEKDGQSSQSFDFEGTGQAIDFLTEYQKKQNIGIPPAEESSN